MLETVEATIDTLGNVKLNEKVRLGRKHKALVTILDEDPERKPHGSIVGSLEIIGDLDEGSAEIADLFNRSIDRTSSELNG